MMLLLQRTGPSENIDNYKDVNEKGDRDADTISDHNDISLLGQMINWKLMMNRMLFPSGLLGYFEMQPWKLHKALQDYLSFQDYLQTEGLWAFCEFNLSMDNPSKMLASAS